MKSANNLAYAKVVLNGYEKAKNGKSVCVITKNDGSCGDYVMLVYGKPAVVGGIIHAMDFSFGSMAPNKKLDWLYYIALMIHRIDILCKMMHMVSIKI